MEGVSLFRDLRRVPPLEKRLTAFHRGGKRLSIILGALCGICRPGVSIEDLFQLCNDCFKSQPFNLIVSSESYPHEEHLTKGKLQENRLYTIDLSFQEGVQWLDGARTVPCGLIDEGRKSILQKLDQQFQVMLEELRWDETFPEYCTRIRPPGDFPWVNNMGGHGIGRELHQRPDYLYGTPSSFPMKENSFFTLEPVFCSILDKEEIYLYHECSIYLSEKEMDYYPKL